MQIVLNGQTQTVSDNITLSEFLAQQNIEVKGIAVSVNNEIVPKLTFSSFVLQDGMELNVFSLVAGG